MTCLGAGEGDDGPGGIALLDHGTFDVIGAWEKERGPQYLAYDAWWHLKQNTLISSEWGTPAMIEDGLVPDMLLGQQVRTLDPLLGSGGRHPHATGRPRRPAPDAPRAAALPRPRGHLGLRRCGGLHRGPLRIGLRLAPRRRPVAGGQGHLDPRRPADVDLLPPALKPFGPSRRWSPTSTCRLTTACSTSRAGGPVSSSSTTSPILPSRAKSARCTWAGSSLARRTPRLPTCRSPAAPRWSR